MGNQAASRDAQTEFEAIVMQLFRGTVAIIGLPRKAAVPPPTTCVGTDGERQRVNHLHGVCSMPAHLDEAPLNSGLELPEVGSLPHKERAIRERGEVRAIVRPEIGEEIHITGQLEKFTANNHGDDLDIAQLGYETAVPYGTSRGEMPIMFLYQTVHRNDKSIAVHWRPPRIVVVTRQLFYEEVSNGSPQELHIRLLIAQRLFEKLSIGGISSVHSGDERQSIPHRPH